MADTQRIERPDLPAGPATAPPPAPPPPFRRRGVLRWVLLAVAVVLVLVTVVVVARVAGALSSVAAPAEETVDRSQPVLLTSLQDLSRYQAAQGTFQVVVDLETDNRFLPSVIAGERTLFVAAGTVESYVDFSGLADDALTVSEDRTSVSIELARPQLDEPDLDLEASYVFAEERGIVDRFESLFGDDDERLRRLYVLAEDRIGEAAGESELVERAEANTVAMLTGLLGALGFSTVEVVFVQP